MLFTKRKQYEMSLKKRADDVQNEKDQLEKKVDTLQYNMNKLIELDSNILAMEKDKLGDPIIVYTYSENENSRDVYIKDSHSKLKEWDFAILSTYHSSEKTLHIEEISGTTINQGYGTIALNHLKEIAHSLRVKKITGQIKGDLEHYERVEHFFKKHGFSISTDTGYVEWIRPYR